MADDWVSGAHPLDMVEEALPTAVPARLRLFAAEVCHAVGCEDAWATLIRTAEGRPAEEIPTSLPAYDFGARTTGASWNPVRRSRREELRQVVQAAFAFSAWEAARGAATAAFPLLQQDLIPLVQCIFPNPFRPVAFDPSWRTSTAVGLARTMYESRDFAAMPILADALEETGCDQPDLLAHCRGPGPHVRGCWVVDLVLGKS